MSKDVVYKEAMRVLIDFADKFLKEFISYILNNVPEGERSAILKEAMQSSAISLLSDDPDLHSEVKNIWLKRLIDALVFGIWDESVDIVSQLEDGFVIKLRINVGDKGRERFIWVSKKDLKNMESMIEDRFRNMRKELSNFFEGEENGFRGETDKD